MDTGVTLEVAGEAICLLGARAAWWPARRWLWVSDVHLGKSEVFRRAGVPLPLGDTADDLARLAEVVRSTGAERLLLLGDLVHHARGLSDEVVEATTRWRAEVDAEVTLVRGNHDASVHAMPPAWRIEDAGACLREGPFAFVHEATPGGDRFAWGGHVHPVFRLEFGPEVLRPPCFWLGQEHAILPSFGAFTGGHRVYAAPGDRVVVCVDGEAIDVTGVPITRGPHWKL